MRFGLDSTSMVPVAAHHAIGSTVALRYLSRSTYKVITRAEHEQYKAAGIDLVLVFEDDGRPDLHGYDGGKADAEFALKQATSMLGLIAKPRIRFAADYDPAGNAAATDAYYDGAAAVFPRADCGPYGGIEVIRRQAGRGFGQLWQSYAWSAGQFDSRASAYQYSNDHTVAGVGVDFNHLFGYDFGQWNCSLPGPADPHHYRRFDTRTKWTLARHEFVELPTVVEYDKLRHHPFVHRPRLKVLRAELRFLANKVYEAAHETTPPNWNLHHRGWRYQQLARRSLGGRLAV